MMRELSSEKKKWNINFEKIIEGIQRYSKNKGLPTAKIIIFLWNLYEEDKLVRKLDLNAAVDWS